MRALTIEEENVLRETLGSWSAVRLYKSLLKEKNNKDIYFKIKDNYLNYKYGLTLAEIKVGKLKLKKAGLVKVKTMGFGIDKACYYSVI